MGHLLLLVGELRSKHRWWELANQWLLLNTLMLMTLAHSSESGNVQNLCLGLAYCPQKRLSQLRGF